LCWCAAARFQEDQISDLVTRLLEAKLLLPADRGGCLMLPAQQPHHHMAALPAFFFLVFAARFQEDQISDLVTRLLEAKLLLRTDRRGCLPLPAQQPTTM
jgi:hypothetical protein